MSSSHDRSGLRVPHDRRSIRLLGYDYAQPGAYFVTTCTRQHRHLFGEIIEGAMHLNALGLCVQRSWLATPHHFPDVELDAFVIMPDHVHGIVWIIDDGSDGVGARHAGVVGARHALPLPMHHPEPYGPRAAFGHPPARALSAIVGSFKSAAARAIDAGLGRPGTPIWQRNYHEHIIRNDRTLRRIRRYIETNPARWPRS